MSTEPMPAPCALCRGACCESIVVPRLPGDVGFWLDLHGTEVGGTHLELPTPCKALGVCGDCTIHARRPENCRRYEVGGAECRATVLRRRPQQAAEILAAMP